MLCKDEAPLLSTTLNTFIILLVALPPLFSTANICLSAWDYICLASFFKHSVFL